jgi:hypothetical protein
MVAVGTAVGPGLPVQKGDALYPVWLAAAMGLMVWLRTIDLGCSFITTTAAPAARTFRGLPSIMRP